MIFKETNIESSILQMLQEIGYEDLRYSTYFPSGDQPKIFEYVVDKLLRDKITLINKSELSVFSENDRESIIDQVIKEVLNISGNGIFQKNKNFHKKMTEGFKINTAKNGKSSVTIYVIDWDNKDNNTYHYVSQLAFQEGHSMRIPDILLYVNGIPLVIFELKKTDANNSSTDLLQEAYRQLGSDTESSGYRYDIPGLFYYNSILIVADLNRAKIGNITSSYGRFQVWRNDPQLRKKPSFDEISECINNLLRPEILIDYIKNYIFFETDYKSKITKVNAQYHQYYAAKTALKSILDKKKPNGDGKAGLVWHTQGSGKSYTMVFLVNLLIRDSKLSTPTVLVLTDRKDLEEQLYNTFSKSTDFLFGNPQRISSRKELLQKIKSVQVGGIYFSSVQKFQEYKDEEDISSLSNNRPNIIVISDEAHRSHNGLEAKFDRITSFDSVDRFEIDDNSSNYGYEKYIRDALPNAVFIGFTGTPRYDEEKDTRVIFGDTIHSYDMEASIRDGSTVPLWYESRFARVFENQDGIRKIDEIIDEGKSLLKDKDKYGPELESRIASNFARIEKIAGTEKNISNICADLIQHYLKRSTILSGKALVVAMSREIAFKMYKKLLEIAPDHLRNKIKVVATVSNKDSGEMRTAFGNSDTHKEIANKFKGSSKDEDGSVKIVIVVDMWLTGFDVQDLDTIYIYKKMINHNLMQAIARVNRAFPNKNSGLVVDYIGIKKELDESMNMYKIDNYRSTLKDVEKDAWEALREKIECLKDLFHKCNIDYNSFFYPKNDDQLSRRKVIINAVDFIIKNDTKGSEIKKKFMESTRLMKISWELSRAIIFDDEENQTRHKEARKYCEFFLLVKKIIKNSESSSDSSLDLSQIVDLMNKRIEELLNKAVDSDQVVSLTGNKQVLINLNNIKGLRETSPDFYITMINKIMEQQIRSVINSNRAKYVYFTDKLKKIMSKYNDRSGREDNTLSTIMSLENLPDEFSKDELEYITSNLNERQKSIFYAVLSPFKSRDDYEKFTKDESFKNVARDLGDFIDRQLTFPDWQNKESLKRKFRITVREILDKWNYPPINESEKEHNEAIEIVKEQAIAITEDYE